MCKRLNLSFPGRANQILRVCVMDRIGELREVMDDILRRQCDYDPASGDTYDFDR